MTSRPGRLRSLSQSSLSSVRPSTTGRRYSTPSERLTRRKHYLDEKLATEGRVVDIDELPYLVEEHDALRASLQGFVEKTTTKGQNRCSSVWVEREHGGIRSARPREPVVRSPGGERSVSSRLPSGSPSTSSLTTSKARSRRMLSPVGRRCLSLCGSSTLEASKDRV